MGETRTVARRGVKEPQIARISLLVPHQLRDRLAKDAARDRRSLNGQCVVLIERALRADGQAQV